MRSTFVVVVAVAIGLATQLVANGQERACDAAGLVTARFDNVEIKSALREVARQTGLNIAVPPRLRGKVTVNFQCATPKAALREVVGQIGASYCQNSDLIVIVRRPQPCAGTLHTPRGPERVSSS